MTQSKHKFSYIQILIVSLISLLVPSRVFGQFYADIAVSMNSITDTTWADKEGHIWNAVFPGDLYAYTIELNNLSPESADSIRVTQTIPNHVTVVESENDPFRSGNTLIWDIDSLAGQDNKSWQVVVQLQEDSGLEQILSEVACVCPQDTVMENNTQQDTIRVLSQVVPSPDLSVSQVVHSDSFKIVGNDSMAVLRQGAVYPISISLANWTSIAAQNVRLRYVAHDSLQIFSASPSPEVFTSDSIVWHLAQIDPVRSLKFQVDVMVPTIMPVGENSLFGTIRVRAENEDSTKIANNTSTLEMINYGQAAEPFEPLVRVTPTTATANDSLKISVQFPIHILFWDMWVYLPDGSIMKDFADNYISSTLPLPNQWYEISEPFIPFALQSNESSKQLIFEVRATADYGSFGSAQATATISRANEFALIPPNVVSPDMSEIPIQFYVPDGYVEMNLYDLAGRLVHELVNEHYAAGRHTFMWNGITNRGQQIGSGAYLVTLKVADARTWKKMIVVR